ncbi:hypothetical protein V1264_010164 [Littorina saxatilis]|uniref:G-protein coupled receptors family 1 profile domain-containing protein n=2 Tax=Littorina saxatilis TaxID=31220 RepID=A0AAN9AP55_9CAEN
MTTLLTSTMLTLTTTHHYNNNDNDENNISMADSVDYGTTFILDDFTNDTTDNSSLSNMTGYYPHPGIIIQVLARFHLIALPTIAVLGIISNILSFCIFISKTLRRTSCSIYLAARSVSDTGFLLSLFISWLGDAMSVPVVHTIVVCQVRC